MSRPMLVPPPPPPPERQRSKRAVIVQWFFIVVLLLNPVAALIWSLTGTAWPSIVVMTVGFGLFITGLAFAIARSRRKGEPWWTAFKELRS